MKGSILVVVTIAFCLFKSSVLGKDIDKKLDQASSSNYFVQSMQEDSSLAFVAPDDYTNTSQVANNKEVKSCVKYPDNYQVLQANKGCMKRCCGPYVDFYLLVWQSKESSLEYASKNDITSPSQANFAQKQYVVIPDFGWRPGFKFDVGYAFEEDNWDIKTLWTFYHGEFTHVKKHANESTATNNGGIIPLHFISSFRNTIYPSPRYNHATGDWYMYFNSIDGELARNFFVRKNLSTRLLFGIKGAWIKQNYMVEYDEGNTISEGTTTIRLVNNHANFKNLFWGMGPRIGFESKCLLKWGFKLFANTSASTLLSHFQVKRKQHDRRYNNATYEDIPIKVKDDFYSIKPNVQVVLGFEWSRCFRQSFFAASLGYEMQYFWGINQMMRTAPTSIAALFYSNRGDLQLHGLTAGLKYDF